MPSLRTLLCLLLGPGYLPHLRNLTILMSVSASICIGHKIMIIIHVRSVVTRGFQEDKNIHNCSSKQNKNFRPKGEGRSGRRPLLPKRKLNILEDLTLGKSYHSVVTFLHAQKIKCYTFSIQTSSKLISYYVCPWKVGP